MFPLSRSIEKTKTKMLHLRRDKYYLINKPGNISLVVILTNELTKPLSILNNSNQNILYANIIEEVEPNCFDFKRKVIWIQNNLVLI